MKIEIWSDVVCPWCYIGKRRLEAALDDFDGDVDIRWRSFELDPDAPQTFDAPLDEILAQKYRTSLERARQMIARITDTAADEGLELDLENARGGNTLDAHRLIHFAETAGLQSGVKERLFSAYMTEGRPISDRDELAAIAAEAGLDETDVHAMFDSDDFVDDVRRDEAEARRLGVRGVPFFLIDATHSLSGAQPTDVLKRALQEAASH